MPRSSDARTRRELTAAWRAAATKKALDPVVLDVRELAGFTDYFLICSAANPRQAQAIADAVDLHLAKELQRPAAHREGYVHAEWIVLDYLGFVVHIFSERSRQFYGLERLWQKAPRVGLDRPPRRRAALAGAGTPGRTRGRAR